MLDLEHIVNIKGTYKVLCGLSTSLKERDLQRGRFAVFRFILDFAELASLAAFLTLIAVVARSVGAA